MSEALFGARMLEFNQLPSRTLHPSRLAEHAPPGAAAPAGMEAAWHRLWSGEILARLGLASRPVLDGARPELALALLPPDRLGRCARLVGAALCAPRLRRMISGAEVREVLGTLGPDVLALARHDALARSGIAESAGWPLARTVAAVDELGLAATRAALSDGGDALALRAELKLPAVPAAAAPLAAPAALALALDVLKHAEPTWASSFPTLA
ncbi:SctK family type III secretion system sorting platform protein [Bordetella genomosp. 1]|uniref:Type III secretion protein n=1 Tax=Bordetella genomosp. 1 TaxID=1395607 RepID=A0ABX4ETT8_9BORD|nr:SctK family type III secretion system sorting platform protein [Bordetella genomosp. 1]OZI57185.1 hypothetical protein CAL27_23370 [Bordetella genomosp. 1]